MVNASVSSVVEERVDRADRSGGPRWSGVGVGAGRGTSAARRGRSWRLGAYGLAWVLVAGLGCGSGSKRRPDLGNTAFNPTSGDIDAGGGEPAAGAPGDSGDAGAIQAPGDAGGAVGALCGDGLLDPEEACDGALPAYRSCRLLGFEHGELSCNADCTWSIAACSGSEDCTDGRDNDGDADVDCEDADCGARCADACASPVLLSPSSSVTGSTLGHEAALTSSCGGSAEASEVAYRVDISEEGKLDVLIESDAALGVSVRTSCADDGSEVMCGERTRVTLDAQAGESYTIVVDGNSSGAAGEFLLSVALRQPACGDGIRDSHEQCDDGNINDGDGCDPDCVLESSETEQNDALGSADTYDFEPWAAEIGAEGDVDFYAVTLTFASSTLVVDTLNFGDGACALNLMDTVIDILDTDTNGHAVLVSDDDSGEGACARAVTSGLGPGTYFVRVAAGQGAAPATFPYRLVLSVGECGDGELTLGEQCDDHNQVVGDGCDASCRSET